MTRLMLTLALLEEKSEGMLIEICRRCSGVTLLSPVAFERLVEARSEPPANRGKVLPYESGP